MKVFVTKYALSSGIQEVEGDTTPHGYFNPHGRYGLYSKGEWFESKQDAIENAEERRIKKLQSLDKQVKKISALKFS